MGLYGLRHWVIVRILVLSGGRGGPARLTAPRAGQVQYSSVGARDWGFGFHLLFGLWHLTLRPCVLPVDAALPAPI